MSLVSVVIPVYHPNIEYIKLAVKSILTQTHKELEVIIIEDDPEGIVKKVLDDFGDERIVYVGNTGRLGIAASINKGLDISKGKYIARMDDDDFSLRTRIKTQHDFMEKNQSVGVCGTWCIKSDDHDLMALDKIGYEKRKVKFLFENEGLFHPTAFFRKSFIKENNLKYDEDMLCAEDYDMWERCCQISDIYTIQEPLLIYRIHESQATNNPKQKLFENKTKRKQLDKFNLLSDREKDIFMDFICPSVALHKSIKKMVKDNRYNKYYSKLFFEGAIGCKWLGKCFDCYKSNVPIMIYEGVIKNPINLFVILLYVFLALQNKIQTQMMKYRIRMSKRYKNIIRLANKIGL